jgi:Dullard-like phosphatase family protein
MSTLSSRFFPRQESAAPRVAPRTHRAPLAADAAHYEAARAAPQREFYTAPKRSTTPKAAARHTAAAAPRAAAPAAAVASSSSFMTQAARGADAARPASSHRAAVPRPVGPGMLPAHPFSNRPLLVLDMDETLLHASVTPVEHDVSFVVHMDGGNKVPIYVKFRPFYEEFLRIVATKFEVCVFTASIPRYANQVLDYIDPSGRLIHHRLFRQHCTEVNGTYVKDLGAMGRPLERVAIVDNSPVAYGFHPENAIPIVSWYDCPQDRALVELLPMLDRLAFAPDVYPTLRAHARKERF